MLPGTQGPEHCPDTGNDIVVTVQADGYAFIGRKWYPASDLLAGITTTLAKNAQSPVLVRIDRALPFRSVRSILRVLQNAQIQSVLLVTYEGYPDEDGFPLPLLFKDAT